MNNFKNAFLGLTLFVISCNQPATKETTSTDTTQKPAAKNPSSFTIENNKAENFTWETLNGANYSMQYPSTWIKDESGQMRSGFFLSAPPETGDAFSPNVNLMIQDVQGKHVDLDRFTTISEKQIVTIVKNGKLLTSERIESMDDEYQKVVYTCTQEAYQLRIEQYYRVENDKAYVLTFTCEEKQAAEFGGTGEKMLNSFKLKK